MMLCYNGEILKLNLLNSSTDDQLKINSKKVLAILCHNGEINELNPLNSHTGQRPFQNLSKKSLLRPDDPGI